KIAMRFFSLYMHSVCIHHYHESLEPPPPENPPPPKSPPEPHEPELDPKPPPIIGPIQPPPLDQYPPPLPPRPPFRLDKKMITPRIRRTVNKGDRPFRFLLACGLSFTYSPSIVCIIAITPAITPPW